MKNNYQSRLVMNAQKLGYDPLKLIRMYSIYEIKYSGYPEKPIEEKHKEQAFNQTMKDILVQYNTDNQK